MNLISGIETTASALTAEKTRMDVVAENIANAHTTRDANGHAYRRKVVSFASYLGNDHAPGKVRVGSVTEDPTPGEHIHDPEHPDANADGMVEMPNVNPAYEMVDLVSSSRAYEANLAVIRNAKQLAAKALSIGR